MPPDRLPPGAADGAPGILPGLVMATAIHSAGRVDFLPVASMASVGGTDAVWAQALRNVETLDGLDVVREEVAADRRDTTLITISGADPFVASRVAVLPWVLARVEAGPTPYGVLVAVPTLGKLVLHVVAGAGVLTVAETMALAAEHWFGQASGHEGVSPDVYLVSPDGHAQAVAHPSATGGVTVNTTGLFGEVLFSPPPRGLGLTA
jgi:hypothetical protein